MTNPFTLTKEQYQELYQEVLLFAKIGGVANDEEGIWKMCHEEFVNELLPAIEAEDRIQIIDGVADSFVVFTQLHNHFLSKPSWEQPQYSTTGMFDEEYLEYMISIQGSQYVACCIRELLDISSRLSFKCNFNLYKAIKEVNRSNMTKFVPTKEWVKRYGYGWYDVKKLAEEECEQLSDGKYTNVHASLAPYSETVNVAVFRENFGNGKIVKHLAFYEEPNFEHCLLEN